MARQSERLLSLMQRLRLLHLPACYEQLADTAAQKNQPYLDFLENVLEAESQAKFERNVRLKTLWANFPFQKRLDQFDFTFQPSIDERKIRELAGLRFLENQENVILLGPPGVGKTHLAIALGLEAILKEQSAYFVTMQDLVAQLAQARHENRLKEKMATFVKKAKLLILDEIGYLPVDSFAATCIFQIVSERYEHGSILLTSNKSYGEWGEIFHDNALATAVLDRLLHHSHTINIKGDSYRLKEKRKAGLLAKTAAAPSSNHSGGTKRKQGNKVRKECRHKWGNFNRHKVGIFHLTLTADADVTEPVHRALQDKDLLPRQHLVDTGYLDAKLLVSTQQDFGLDLVGPTRDDYRWQAQKKTGYAAQHFHINWEQQQATCPQGKTSIGWSPVVDYRGNEVIKIKFSTKDCRRCPQQSQCTSSPQQRRSISVRPHAQYIALEQARARQRTTEYAVLKQARAGVEGTISQGVRCFGLRRSRYRGLAKTHLQHVITAAAFNLVRVGYWLGGQLPASTRHSAYAQLMGAAVC